MNLDNVGASADAAPSGLDDQAPHARIATEAPGARQLVKKYVILATPRSGSSHLVDLLDSHPQLCCAGELFNPHGAALRKLGMRNKDDMRLAGQAPLEFLDRVIAKTREGDEVKPCFGFKLMLHHDPRMIDHVLEDPQWCVIVLERRDLLAQWTSAGLAKKTGQWGSGKKAVNPEQSDDPEAAKAAEAERLARAAQTKVVFNAQKFEQYCIRMNARYESIYYRLGPRPYFRLFSEDIDASHQALLEFLGAEATEVQAPRPRQNSTSMRDRIRNYEHYVKYAREHGMPVK
jgi:LPS sulfotransferase NodH